MTVITHPRKGVQVHWMGQGGGPSKIRRMESRDVTYLGRSGVGQHIISWKDGDVEVVHKVPTYQLHSLPLDNGRFPVGSKCIYRDREWFVVGLIVGEDPDKTRMIAQKAVGADIHRDTLFIDMDELRPVNVNADNLSNV